MGNQIYINETLTIIIYITENYKTQILPGKLFNSFYSYFFSYFFILNFFLNLIKYASVR